MMKKLLLRGRQRWGILATLLLLAVAAWAVPAKPGLTRLLTLSNGTTVTATLVGDEYGHCWKGADGKNYQAVAGTKIYQEVNGPEIIAKAKQRRIQANGRRAQRLASRRSIGEINPISGEKKGLIILVNFQDVKFQPENNKELYNRIANEENFSDGDFKGSMYDYFYAQSEGQFSLTFDVVGPVTVSKPQAYYGENDTQGEDKHDGEMVIEAIQLADEYVNYSDYDWDYNGEVDQVYLVYAGKGEADGGGDYTIWPHEWTLYSAKCFGDGSGPQTLDGVKIDTYACGGELVGSKEEPTINGIGTMCHEFAHCLGYPDFYDTDYSGGPGMGDWDLMNSGSYNGGGYLPAGFTSYERWIAGWKTPIELTSAQNISNMEPLQTKGSNTYIIYNKGNNNEYYLLENRQKIGWDAALPGEGLLILHVDYDHEIWAQNHPNDDPDHQRLTWVPANNDYRNQAGGPYPYGDNHEFGRNTIPAATFYNQNSDGSYFLDSNIENITQNDDHTVSFEFVTKQALEEDPNTVIFGETFNKNTNLKGGRDGNFNLGSGQNIAFDNEGWIGNYSSKIYGANQCIRFGTDDIGGTLTSPAISVGDADHVLLTFSAAGWGDTKKNTLTITANEGFTLSGDNDITELVNEEWKDYTVLIKVTDKSASLQLTFTGKRGFLDDIAVRSITTVPAPTLADNFTFYPNTTEENASSHVTLTPKNYTVAYYTTDGSTPSKTNGTEALLPASVPIHGTTTVKAIAYVGDLASKVVTRYFTQGSTVNGISEFCDLKNNTEARLFLADDENHETRVLYYDESRGQLFLRENAKALCVDFGTTATFSSAPKYNQHIGGWIVGKKATENGMPKLVATENTTSDYLAIANPVTESQTMPASIGNDELNSHLADWVTIEEQRVGQDIGVTNRFGKDVYEGALTDLSGIVISSGDLQQIAPITQNDIPAVVYVVDEDKEFVSPDADIPNAIVRLNRTLSSSYWNTFVVPFNIATMEGDIREYSAQNGNTMVFAKANSIEAGKPYIVKPVANVENPTYSNVTLSATPAQSVDNDGYSFVAIYSPTELATNQTELFLKSDGRLYYSENESENRLKGMRAYFKAPSGQAPLLSLDGETTGISEKVRENSEKFATAPVYNLNGQRVTHLTKGLYIVNGKKVIIK